MFSLTLKHGQPSVFIKEVAGPGGNKIYNDILVTKNNLVSGYFKAFNLHNGIKCLCAKYSLQEDFHLHKMPVASEFFILRIHEISKSSNTLLIADRKYNAEPSPKSHSVLLLSSLEEFAFFASKNSSVKTLEILIPRQFFFRQLNMDCSYELLKNYLAFKTRKNIIDFGNLIFKNAFLKIIQEANKNMLDLNFLKKNVKNLLEVFFSAINSGLNDFLEIEKVIIAKDEINRLITVKKHLENDAGSTPPKFSSLTKMALMSSTSLKRKFRKMYGTTVFEYFQRMRMQRARILLLTHKYSVKQIGLQIGYANLSNFTIAFKKEFNQLPHELIKNNVKLSFTGR